MNIFLAVNEKRLEKYIASLKGHNVIKVKKDNKNLAKEVKEYNPHLLIISNAVVQKESNINIIKDLRESDTRIAYLYGDDDEYRKVFTNALIDNGVYDFYVGVIDEEVIDELINKPKSKADVKYEKVNQEEIELIEKKESKKKGFLDELRRKKKEKEEEKEKLKAKEEVRLREEAELKAKEEARLKEEAELRAKEEARLREEAELRAKEEARLREEAELKAKEEAKLKENLKTELEEKDKREKELNKILLEKEEELNRLKAEHEEKEEELFSKILLEKEEELNKFKFEKEEELNRLKSELEKKKIDEKNLKKEQEQEALKHKEIEKKRREEQERIEILQREKEQEALKLKEIEKKRREEQERIEILEKEKEQEALKRKEIEKKRREEQERIEILEKEKEQEALKLKEKEEELLKIEQELEEATSKLEKKKLKVRVVERVEEYEVEKIVEKKVFKTKIIEQKTFTFISLVNQASRDFVISNLAVALSNSHKVLIMDFDTPFPTIDRYFDVDKNIYLEDTYSNKRLTGLEGCLSAYRRNVLEKNTFFNFITKTKFENIDILTGVFDIEVFDSVEAEEIKAVLDVAKQNYETIIVSANQFIANLFTYVAMENSEKVVLVSDDTYVNARNNISFIKEMVINQKENVDKFNVLLFGKPLLDEVIIEKVYEGYNYIGRIPTDINNYYEELSKQKIYTWINSKEREKYSFLIKKLGLGEVKKTFLNKILGGVNFEWSNIFKR